MQLRDNTWNYGKTGIFIAVFCALMIANATWFFLGMANFPVTGWLCFNACTPSVLIFLTGFALKRIGVMAMSVPALLFFGGTGLFIFGWRGSMIFGQMSHIAMVMATAYTIFIAVREKRWKNSIIGTILGAVLLAGILPFQQGYVRSHPELLKKLGDPSFEEFMNSK